MFPLEVRNKLLAKGCQDASDVSGILRTDQAVSELISPLQLSESQVLDTFAAVEHARMSSSRTREYNVAKLVRERCTPRSSSATTPAVPVKSRPAIPAATSKIKPKLALKRKLVLTDASLAVDPAAPPVVAAIPDVQHQPGPKIEAALEALWEVYATVGDAGSKWHPSSEVYDESSRRAFILEPVKTRTTDAQQIWRPLAVLRRWLEWRTVHAAASAVWRPSPVVLAAFLRHIGEGGPTAAAGALAQLRWLWGAIGLPFPILEVQSFAVVTVGHSPSQAEELEPSEVWSLLKLLALSAGAGGYFLQMVLSLIFACIRWKHQERSYILADCAQLLYVWCKQGKRRVKGHRPGFGFCIPKCTFLPDVDLGLGLENIYTQVAAAGNAERFPCLVQDIRPAAKHKGTLNLADGVVINKGMTYNKFNELLRGLLIKLGASNEQATRVTYNSLRRTVPTMGRWMRLSGPQQQSLSNWQDVPEAAKDPSLPASMQRATFPMGSHYAGGAIEESGRTKLCLLFLFHKAMARFVHKKLATGQLQLSPEGFLPYKSVTWAELSSERPGPEQAEAELQKAGEMLHPGAVQRPWLCAGPLASWEPSTVTSEPVLARQKVQAPRQSLEVLLQSAPSESDSAGVWSSSKASSSGMPSTGASSTLVPTPTIEAEPSEQTAADTGAVASEGEPGPSGRQPGRAGDATSSDNDESTAEADDDDASGLRFIEASASLKWFCQPASPVVHITQEMDQGFYVPLSRSEPFRVMHSDEAVSYTHLTLPTKRIV